MVTNVPFWKEMSIVTELGDLRRRGTGRNYKAILLYFPFKFYMNLKLFHKNKIHNYKK